MIIYKATNLINGKCYIGQTKQKLKKRIKDHKNSKNNQYFHNAIRKYGIKNFKWEVVYECDDKLILNFMETFKIIVNHSHISENGYNLSWGGESGTYGYKFTEKQLENMKNTHSGKDNGFYGKTHTKKTREYLRKINLGKTQSFESNEKRSKKLKGRIISFETRKKMSNVIWHITKDGITENVEVLSIWCSEHGIKKSIMKDRERYGTSYMGYTITKSYKGEIGEK